MLRNEKARAQRFFKGKLQSGSENGNVIRVDDPGAQYNYKWDNNTGFWEIDYRMPENYDQNQFKSCLFMIRSVNWNLGVVKHDTSGASEFGPHDSLTDPSSLDKVACVEVFVNGMTSKNQIENCITGGGEYSRKFLDLKNSGYVWDTLIPTTGGTYSQRVPLTQSVSAFSEVIHKAQPLVESDPFDPGSGLVPIAQPNFPFYPVPIHEMEFRQDGKIEDYGMIIQNPFGSKLKFVIKDGNRNGLFLIDQETQQRVKSKAGLTGGSGYYPMITIEYEMLMLPEDYPEGDLPANYLN